MGNGVGWCGNFPVLFSPLGQLRGESDTARRLLVTLHSICPRPILFMDDDPSDALDSQDSGVTVIQRYGRNSLRRCLFAETRGEQDASAHRLFTASEKTRASWDASKVRYHYPNSTDPRPKFSSGGAACWTRSRLRTNSTPARSRRAVAGRHVPTTGPSPVGQSRRPLPLGVYLAAVAYKIASCT